MITYYFFTPIINLSTVSYYKVLLGNKTHLSSTGMVPAPLTVRFISQALLYLPYTRVFLLR